MKTINSPAAPKSAEHDHPFRIGIHCKECRSTQICRDAVARWSEPEQVWELSSTQDNVTCDDCGCETTVNRLRDMEGMDAGPVTPQDCYEGETFEAVQVIEPLHALARAFMAAKPQFAPASLDEWLADHDQELSQLERRTGYAILNQINALE
jgi:ribosomal protein S27E